MDARPADVRILALHMLIDRDLKEAKALLDDLSAQSASFCNRVGIKIRIWIWIWGKPSSDQSRGNEWQLPIAPRPRDLL
jgi:hypothetical protein